MQRFWEALGRAIVDADFCERLRAASASAAKTHNVREVHDLVNDCDDGRRQGYMSRGELGELCRFVQSDGVYQRITAIRESCWSTAAVQSLPPSDLPVLYTALGILFTDQGWARALMDETEPEGGHPLPLSNAVAEKLRDFLTVGLQQGRQFGAQHYYEEIEELLWEPGSCLTSATYSPNYRHATAMTDGQKMTIRSISGAALEVEDGASDLFPV